MEPLNPYRIYEPTLVRPGDIDIYVWFIYFFIIYHNLSYFDWKKLGFAPNPY